MGLKEGYYGYDYNYEYGGECFDGKYLILFYVNVYVFIYTLIRFIFIIAIVYVFIIDRINVNILK